MNEERMAWLKSVFPEMSNQRRLGAAVRAWGLDRDMGDEAWKVRVLDMMRYGKRKKNRLKEEKRGRKS